MNPTIQELTDRYLRGELSEVEIAALEQRLSTDDAERTQFRRTMRLEANLRALADEQPSEAAAWSAPSAQVEATLTESLRALLWRWLSWRPLAAAAAGLVIGMFCTSVVYGYVAPRAMEKVKLVLSEGFESGDIKTLPDLPPAVGLWSGDEAEVVKAMATMKARSGGKLLRFISATYPGEDSPRSQWGDVYRLVDVRGLGGTGRTVVRLSASFAQDSASAEERFVGRAEALAIDKELSALPTPLTLAWLQQNNSAMGSRRAVLTTAQQWQEVSVEVPITPETRYVMLHLAVVQEQPVLSSGAVQFPGHYMDDVKLELVSGR